MNLKKIGKVFTSKSVGTGPLSYEKRIYRPAVSQKLRNTVTKDTIFGEKRYLTINVLIFHRNFFVKRFLF